ncbi:hypothetical protein TYRP_013435 [Tyrophagus putrescentiae]|nr:hypothetical protein TYRP_013435 [Tyrophagus putrescentiae]
MLSTESIEMMTRISSVQRNAFEAMISAEKRGSTGKSVALTGSQAAGTTAALGCLSSGDVLHLHHLKARLRREDAHFHLASVNDEANVRYGDGGLGDVSGEDHPAKAVITGAVEDGLLLAVRQGRVQWNVSVDRTLVSLVQDYDSVLAEQRVGDGLAQQNTVRHVLDASLRRGDVLKADRVAH